MKYQVFILLTAFIAYGLTKLVGKSTRLLTLMPSKPIETKRFKENYLVKSLTKYPTFATRITKNGFDFFNAIADGIMEKEFPKVEFPNITFPITAGPGYGTANISNLKIQQFLSPNFNIELAPPDGIYLRSAHGVANVQGDWSAEYKVLTTFTTSGWIEAIITDIRSQFTVSTYGKDGSPQIYISDCVVEIQSLSVKIGGGVIPWLVNLLSNDLSILLKRIIHDQFCTTAETTLVKYFNNQIRLLPTRFKIVDDIFVEYFYTNNLIIEKDNAVGQAFLTVTTLQNKTCKLLNQPIWIDPFASKRFMTNLWIEGNVFQCLANSIDQSGVVEFVLTKDFDNGKFETFLSTSCKYYEVCLGKFFKTLKMKYPYSYVDLHFHSANAANVNISEKGVFVKTFTHMDFYISPWKKNPDILARLELGADFDIKPLISYKKICGILKKDINLTFIEIFTNIGSFHESLLNMLGVIMGPVIRIFADGQLMNGFPIPLFENVTLSDGAQIQTFDNGQIRVDANLQYV